MPDLDPWFLDPSHLIIDRFIPDLTLFFPQPAKVRILIVLENTLYGGPPGTGFGLGRVVSYLRDEPFGFVNFEVDFARRGTDPSPTAVNENAAPGDWGDRYTNFRFHSVVDGQQIIDDYDEIWMFGINPSIHDNGTNNQVESDPHSPDDAETAVLSDWMDEGGGVLAMGDHNFLGSAMCWKLPRVGTMRAWRKDANEHKSVPNRTGSDRHDTNQPQNDSQDPTVTSTPSQIPTSAEEDTVTQPLEWKGYTAWSPLVFERRIRPHPVLCGGGLGVIDRFPDHPHEGLVVHEAHIDLSATCIHDGSKDEYPTVGGAQPAPEVVAWVHCLPDPPYNHAKQDQPSRRIPAIGVYDGHEIEHGRVLVDSTWHHWFDKNVYQLEAADSTDFRKIKRYFQNVAIWLAPKSEQVQMLTHATFWTVLSNDAFEELVPGVSFVALGAQALDILGRRTSDCLVTSWILEHIPIPVRELERPFPFPLPDPCWSCPPPGLIPLSVFGGMVSELLPLRDQLVAFAANPRGAASCGFDARDVEKRIAVGRDRGLEEVVRLVDANLEVLGRASKELRARVEKGAKVRQKGD